MDTETISIDKAKYMMLLGKALGLKTSSEGYLLQEIAGNRLKDIGMKIKAYGDQQEVLSEHLFEAELLIEYVRLHM